MPSVAVVTTFAKDHINLYGKGFVESFKANCNYPLYIYAEDFTAEDIGCNVVDFYTAIPEHTKFKDSIQTQISSLDKKEQNRLRKALRWSYKSFVIIHALENINADYIVWIDADVETVNTIPNNLIESLCGKYLMMCYPQNLDDGVHVESGFVIFNKQHPNIQAVINHYRRGYHLEQILTIKKPWDGYWLANLITTNQTVKEKTYHACAPFSNIRQYFRHNVGKRKFDETGLNKFSGRSENA
jgi:hypothetical protein